MTLTSLHDRLANTILLYVILLAIWGLWRFIRREGLDSSYFGALVIAEVIILGQGLLGMYLWLINLRPDRGGIHILYGVASALVIPAVYVYTRGGAERRASLVYGAVLLFLAGLIIRGITTGGA